jgi:hypothetical protein
MKLKTKRVNKVSKFNKELYFRYLEARGFPMMRHTNMKELVTLTFNEIIYQP